MENSKQRFEIKSSEEVEVLDESALKEAAGGILSLPQYNLAAHAFISPIKLRPIDLVMGKTTLF